MGCIFLNKKLKYFLWTFFGLIFLFIVVFIFFITLLIHTNDGYIYRNVSINNIDVSGLTKSDATELLENKFKLEDLKIHYQDKIWKEKFSNLGFYYDIKKAVDDAYDIGRADTILNNTIDIIGLYIGSNQDVHMGYVKDNDKLKSVIKRISEYIDSEPVQAAIDANRGKIKIKAGKDGKRVKQEELFKNIENTISTSSSNSIDVDIPIDTISPKLKYNQLKNINGMIAVYETRYPIKNISRSHNIAVTANKLDKQLIMPNQEISFLKLLGDVTVAQGFSRATIIVNNKFVDGVGGGVCQVSTTLYNAVLESGLTVKERTHHSLPVHYVPLGRDATVAEGAPDLKYKNEYDFPVYIRMYASNGIMRTEVYGDTTRARNIKIYSRVYGKSAVTYAVENGKTKVISRDVYM